MQEVIVLGGGASGMTAAICAARNGSRVMLLEKGTKLGRKIAASGNGKCNLTNAAIEPKFYHNAYPTELGKILRVADRDAILAFMKSIGVHCKEKRGYYYPMSEQAAVVVQMLQAELEHLQVKVVMEERLVDVVHENNCFCVITDKAKYKCRKLILSCGGRAADKLGGEDTGYRLLQKLGHTVNDIEPALVQLIAKERHIKKIAGVRTEAKIRLKTKSASYSEEGEIIFTENGISGIPVFQLSRYVTEALKRKDSVQLVVDVLPQCNINDMLAEMLLLAEHNRELPLEYLFRSFCNHKLVYAVICELGLKADLSCRFVKQAEIKKIVHALKEIVFTITGTNGFEQAQVTKGGVPLDELMPETMESKKYPGLYITGELVDVDGICGGYNLHFAWASGILAGTAAAVKE